MRRLLFLLSWLLCFGTLSEAKVINKSDLPFIGAQVFIEPGQTDADIDTWFRVMRDAGMTTCRIRMFESYMLQADGSWDFTMFDKAFRAAEKYQVKVYCTFFPATDKLDIGGWKFPKDEAQWTTFKTFIKALTQHYKDHPALAGWVLINEPGIGGGHYPKTPFMLARRKAWDAAHPEKEYTEKGYPILMNTRDQLFLRDVTTDFLGEIASEIAKYDTGHDIHVNPAGVFYNYGDYDFPAWRQFLTSLGGSAHPSWHYGDFKRGEYALAMMTEAEMLRSGAGENPWFMTEIQGGNNTYSGVHAMCPTPEEITQWLWTVIGCEGKGGIFWMLNPRASGIEAGEWALLDFQNKPSARVKAAAQVAQVLSDNKTVFSSMQEIPSGIDVVYLNEALWAENRMARGNDERDEGRQHGAVFKSSAACFRALSERGLNVGLKEINEYDFSKKDYQGQTIIITNQLALPPKYKTQLAHFVDCGGTLIVEGLTGFFDENLHALTVSGSPYSDLLGDGLAEVILESNLFHTSVDGQTLPTHLWRSTLAHHEGNMLVSSHGKGKVVWIPCNIALGARVADNYAPLAQFLLTHAASSASVAFDKYYRGLTLRSLQTVKGMVLICTSNAPETVKPQMTGLKSSAKSKVLYASEGCSFQNGILTMSPRGTCVVLIEK